MSTFGKRVYDRRTEIGMTQDELAQKLGYKHKSSIGKIENGDNDLPLSKVVLFAHALETTVAYLMGWEEEELFNELNIIWDSMNDAQKRTFLSLGHALIDTDNRQTD